MRHNVAMVLDAASRGGIIRNVGDLGVELARRGHDVHFVAAASRGTDEAAASRMIARGLTVLFPPRKGRFAPAVWLRRTLRRLRPDIVHTHGYRSQVYCAFTSPRDAALVATVHGIPVLKSHALERRWVLYRRALRSAAGIVAVCRDTETRLASAGIDRSKLRTVLNGCPVSPTSSDIAPGGHLRLGYIGRLDAGKCLDELLEAVRLGENCSLAIAGEGQERARLELVAARLAIDDRVSFEGWVDDAAAFLASVDCQVLLSRSEGLPISLLEGMSVGRPAIINRIGGMPEVIFDGVNGRVVDSVSPEVIAHALKEVDDRDILRAMGARSREIFEERFNIRQQADGIERLYDDVQTR